MNLLTRSSLRYLDRHRWQFGLSIVGVALGVAVVVSVDLANASAQRAFDLSTGAVTGRTTHQIVGGSQGIPQSLYVRLRTELGLRRIAPVVEGYVSLPSEGEGDGFTGRRTLRVLGVDPFSEAPFRTALGTAALQLDLTTFLTRPGAVLLTAATADSLAVEPGEALRVQAGARLRELQVAGLLTPADARQEEAAADLLIADIASAQEILGLRDRISRIDLIVEESAAGDRLLTRVGELLQPPAQLVPAAARSETTRQLTRAFRLNLTALSLLALVCGVFLVYNTMSFSVVQRRPLIGMMRALGVTRREIFARVLGEALIVGAVGTALGLAGGLVIGRSLIALVSQTINDLYFVVAVRDLALDPLSLAKGAALGLLGSVVAALPAALEATAAPPRAVLMRSQVEARARRQVLPAAGAGVFLLAVGTLLLLFSGRNLPLSFAAMFMTILGFALLTPLAVIAAMRLATAPMAKLLGPLGRIATRGVSASLSRTAVAIAALMIAVSVVVGVGVMIDSFRGTVTRWLDTVLVADLYVAPPSPGSAPVTMEFGEPTRARLAAIEGVARIGTLRAVDLPAEGGGRTRLLVFDVDARGESAFQFTAGDPAEIWRDFRAGDGVIVTEPYAYRHDLTRGDRIELPTDDGLLSFRVAGVYYNYAAEEGIVAMDRLTYERHWADRAVSGLSFYLRESADVALVSRAIRAALGEREVVIQANRALRAVSLEVFDRTFLITGVLRLLVTLVALLGVLSALLSLQIERAHEVGVLRALGLTPREVWRLSVSQSGLMGMVSGLLAIPVGLALAAIMIFVINRRSFGWTLELEAAPEILLQAFLLALTASLIAGLYPARRVAATPPATALREE